MGSWGVLGLASDSAPLSAAVAPLTISLADVTEAPASGAEAALWTTAQSVGGSDHTVFAPHRSMEVHSAWICQLPLASRTTRPPPDSASPAASVVSGAVASPDFGSACTMESRGRYCEVAEACIAF